MRRASLALAVLVLLSAGSMRADVAPFPSWRLAANGTIARAVQAGSAIYVAGTFTRIGRAVPTFSATLDPATLTFVPRTGCAQIGTSPVLGRCVYFPNALSDGAGPSPVAPGTALVRVWPFRPLPFEARGRVYVYAFASQESCLLELDGGSGAVRRYWPSARAPVAGATVDRRLIGTDSLNRGTATGVGVFDPDTGLLSSTYAAPGSWGLRHAGTPVLLCRSVSARRWTTAMTGWKESDQ